MLRTIAVLLSVIFLGMCLDTLVDPVQSMISFLITIITFVLLGIFLWISERRFYAIICIGSIAVWVVIILSRSFYV